MLIDEVTIGAGDYQAWFDLIHCAGNEENILECSDDIFPVFSFVPQILMMLLESDVPIVLVRNKGLLLLMHARLV